MQPGRHRCRSPQRRYHLEDAFYMLESLFDVSTGTINLIIATRTPYFYTRTP